MHPTLQLAVDVNIDEEHSCVASAIVNPELATVFVADATALGHVDGGGRALAALFECERRRVALEWSAAYDQATEGSEVQSIELARDRVVREEEEFNARSRRLSTPVNAGRDNRAATRPVDHGAAIDEHEEQSLARSAGTLRTLVNPDFYELVDAEGRVVRGQPFRRRSVERSMTRDRGELVEPMRMSRAPQNRLPLRGFSGSSRFSVE